MNKALGKEIAIYVTQGNRFRGEQARYEMSNEVDAIIKYIIEEINESAYYHQLLPHIEKQGKGYKATYGSLKIEAIAVNK